MKSRKPLYVVEASFRGQKMADRLKKLVRKPVTYDGGGNGRYNASLGWEYKSPRAARAAMYRLRKAGADAYIISPCLSRSRKAASER